MIFTFPDFSGDCLILSYEGGARRIGDGDPEAVCAEVPWVNCRLAGVGDGWFCMFVELVNEIFYKCQNKIQMGLNLCHWLSCYM